MQMAETIVITEFGTHLRCRHPADSNLDSLIAIKNHILNMFHEFCFAAEFIKLNDDLSFEIAVDRAISSEILQKFIDYFYICFDVEMKIIK